MPNIPKREGKYPLNFTRKNSMASQTKPARDCRIDQFRFIAFMGVFFIHFVLAWNGNHAISLPYAIEIFCFLGRFAVPFFFMASGYFLRLKEVPTKLIWYYAKRLLLPFGIWGGLCWAQDVAMNNPYNFEQMKHLPFYVDFLKTGGAGYHLWFLSSLFMAISTLVIGNRFISIKKILFGSFLLFVLCLIVKPYAPLIWGDNPPIHFGMKNGIITGLFFVTIGASLKEKLQQTTLRTGILVFCAGCVIQAAEAVFLKMQCHSSVLAHDFLFGTLLMGLGSFVVAIHMPFQSAFLASLGRISFGLYLAHILFLKIFIEFFHSDAIVGVLACFVLTLLSTIAFVLLLGRWKVTRFIVS